MQLLGAITESAMAPDLQVKHKHPTIKLSRDNSRFNNGSRSTMNGEILSRTGQSKTKRKYY